MCFPKMAEVVDEIHFNATEESRFIDEVRKFSVLYDTKNQQFKNKKTTKQNAWLARARKFKGNIEMCETR